ncbi:phage tail protein [Leptospira kmetyi]|uniref:Phage tail collar domain-containing protein n=1 Tax=Leptospira kmetyi TaxID=408139 RepID=A0ABX4NCD3_9LEPT|nr:hypothetical protein CH378_14560 [Leptospira kmetyi]PJZ39728.1 hypothetical protein CH370_19955 [Leptospira kmetyi]
MKSFKNDFLKDNLLRSYFDSKLLDESNLRISSDTSLQNQMSMKLNSSEKGAALGLATLGIDGKLVTGQRPQILASEISQDATHRLITDTDRTTWNGALTPDWNAVQNKPTAFPPTAHDHNTNYYTKSEIDSALLLKRGTGAILASDITQDSTHRFITDVERTTWNAGGSGTGFDVGDVKTSARTSTPTGWLLLNGQTLGNSGSGATNSGTAFQNLFMLLWSDWSNIVLPILDSNGSASTRGASALSDWNANKRLSIPNIAGRTPVGVGTGAGLSVRSLGEKFGEENHILTIPEIPSHDHGGGNHNHNSDAASLNPIAGSYVVKTGFSGFGTSATYNSGNIIQSQGGGLGHNNMQPSLVLNFFIKY